MDIRDEKCHVYEQLKLLMEEKEELSRQYYDLKEYLIHLEEDKIVSILVMNYLKKLNFQISKVKKCFRII